MSVQAQRDESPLPILHSFQRVLRQGWVPRHGLPKPRHLLNTSRKQVLLENGRACAVQSREHEVREHHGVVSRRPPTKGIDQGQLRDNTDGGLERVRPDELLLLAIMIATQLCLQSTITTI